MPAVGGPVPQSNQRSLWFDNPEKKMNGDDGMKMDVKQSAVNIYSLDSLI